MNANFKKTPFLVNGLPNSGKTTLISGLIKCARRQSASAAAFKPFDNGLMRRNAIEKSGDGETFLNAMTGEPMEGLVSPYIAHEHYPIEMAFRRDGISTNEHFLKERLAILNNHYDQILIESPGSLFEPITQKKQYYEWMLSISNRIIWVMDLNLERFTHNISELTFLKTLDCEIDLVFNNPQKNQDQDLMFYIWEKMESLLEAQAIGMIPYINQIDENHTTLIDKITEHLSDIIKQISE